MTTISWPSPDVHIDLPGYAELLSPESRRFLVGAPHRLLIGGEWIGAADGRHFAAVDPWDGDVIGDVAWAGSVDVDHAVAAAEDALDGPLERLSPTGRSLLLYRLAELIDRSRVELAELESIDNGKPLSQARWDVDAAAGTLRYFAGWPTKIEGETIPVSVSDVHCYTLREPIGVCAQILPCSFPLLMAVWKIAPAIAAGCSVILKPSEHTPITAIRLAELTLEADWPPGLLNLLTGDASTGAALVDHPGVDKVGFCGSTSVGREIAAKCGRSMKRVSMELSGKNANIILPDADLDAAIEGSFLGMYSNSGQFCDAASRLFVPNDLFETVVERLANLARKPKIGPGLDPSSQLGPMVSASHYEKVIRYIKLGIQEGAHIAAGGLPDNKTARHGVAPTLFTNVSNNMRIAREEIFGPVLVAMPFASTEEVVHLANDTEYGLAAGIWTRDLSLAHKLARRLRAGYVYLNTWWGADDPAAPFGGFKASGLGREKGHYNLDSYLETKTVWTKL